MKQILQHLGDGRTEVVDVPCPSGRAGRLLLRTSRTLISAGTERMLVDFGKASPLEKARQQPDKVKQVLYKMKTDGLLPTVAAVRNKLDQPLSLGYCHVGRVVEVGRGVTGFAVGDRVASNGKHAEVVAVPANLCARIPDAVSEDGAAFAVIGAIALQGIRLVQPTLGEAVVVTGLGLIGQITVQLLRAHGCRVLGLDMDPTRLALAQKFGAEVVLVGEGTDPLAAAQHFSRGRGVDAVIITAATKSNEPMHQAAHMCRQRGRIVLVGVTGLELSRDDFYRKELFFQVSCSYGPGRYDPEYEEKGHDYPFGLVRWTEQRNFEAVLDMLADGRLNVEPLISHRFTIDRAAEAYAVVGGSEPSMGILLEYPEVPGREAAVRASTVKIDSPARAYSVRSNSPGKAPAVSFIGAGNYATAVLIPAFKAAGARLVRVASAAGVTAVHAARKFGFAEATTDTASLFSPGAMDAVVVTTRHDSHARYVLQALKVGVPVFVEKPLCLTVDELDRIAAAYEAAVEGGRSPFLMVGFNRRFAPHLVTMKQALAGISGPKSLVMTVNAGAIPADHWSQDPEVGGGRIIGEACHFIDLLRFLVGVPIQDADVRAVSGPTRDSASITLSFEDGSLGTVHYLANGSKAFPKERLEVFAAGRVLQLDNFRALRSYGWPGVRSSKLWRQDKGQAASAAAFVNALRKSLPPPIPVNEIFEVSRWTIDIAGRL